MVQAPVRRAIRAEIRSLMAAFESSGRAMRDAAAWRVAAGRSRARMICARSIRVLVTLAYAGTGQGAWAAASQWTNDPHGSARLISAVEATGSSEQLDMGLQLRLPTGWHTYWRSPSDAGIPPSIDWKGSVNFAGAEIGWPAPVRLPALGGLETVGYEDGVVLPIAIRLEQPGAPLHLHAEADYASCQEICVPEHASLDLVLSSGLARPGEQASLIAEARTRVPGDLAAAQLKLLGVVVEAQQGNAVLTVGLATTGASFRSPDLFVEGLKGVVGRKN